MIQPEQLFGTLTPPAEIYSQALLTKPSIKAAQYRLEGAARSIRIAQSAYYPQLNFGAGLGTSYYNVSGRENPSFHSQLKDNFSQYVGLSLSIPIFNRLSTRNRVRTARLEQTTLNWQLEETKKKLYKEIQQAYYNAVNAESKYQSSQVADEAAEASFKLMKEKYMYGKANATEYNEARTDEGPLQLRERKFRTMRREDRERIQCEHPHAVLLQRKVQEGMGRRYERSSGFPLGTCQRMGYSYHV